MGSTNALLGTDGNLWSLSVRLCYGYVLSATSRLGNQFAWHSRVGVLICFSFGCDGVFRSAALGQACVTFSFWRDDRTRVYGSRWDHSRNLRYPQAIHGYTWASPSGIIKLDRQTGQDTVPLGEVVDLHRLSL